MDNDLIARLMVGSLAVAIWAGLAVALRTGKMVNLAWSSMPIFERRDRPVYFWINIAMSAALSVFCVALAAGLVG
ncbi:MAG TPA: hypothetical protein VFW13_16390 [Phenylobacterium sp.]|nr:hypothetical protein [Phenylobacterium sp.]